MAATEMDAAVRAAAAAGIELVRVAPPEFHVITKTWYDEWANYTERKTAIAWSTNRIAHAFKRADRWANDDPGWLHYLAQGYLLRDMNPELRRELVEAAATKAGCQIKHSAGHGPGYGYSTDVAIDKDCITYTSRMGIGD